MSVPTRLLDPPEPRHCPVCENCAEEWGNERKCPLADEHERCLRHDNSDEPED